MKYWAYVLIGLLIASSTFAAKAAYGQQTWYPGEGIEKGLLVKYRISTFDHLQSGGKPFLATIWFGSQDEQGNWKTFAFVEEGGKVVSSDMTLSALNLAPIGFDVTEEFKPYRNAIRNSLGWVGDFANKAHPRSITGGEGWGVVAAIGGGGIVVKPTGTETIEVAGKSWETAIIGFHYSLDSQIWINDNFPLPLKAKQYTIATQEPIPVQYEYELLEVGKSDTQPVPPETALELPKPPLSTPTTSGTYNLDLYWIPEVIEPGKPVTLGVVVRDRAENVVKEQVFYDILVTDANGKVVLDQKKVLTKDGQGVHEVTFESNGKARTTVTLIGKFVGEVETPVIEKAEFGLVVVPEFPLGIAAVMATIVAMMVAMTRFKKISMPKL